MNDTPTPPVDSHPTATAPQLPDAPPPAPAADIAATAPAERDTDTDATPTAAADAAETAEDLDGTDADAQAGGPLEATAEDAPEPAAGDAATAARSADRGPQSPAEVGRALAERFPALFAGAPKPLKLRIQADIQARAPGVFSRNALGGFFRRYTGSHGYLQALSRAPQRLDLDGAPAGEISAEHRDAAVAELKRRREIVQARREQEAAATREVEDARRQRAQLLRDFERTTLTRANFCALKGVAPDALDALLAQAKQEAAERPLPPPHGHGQGYGPHGHGQPPRGDRRDGPPGPRRGGPPGVRRDGPPGGGPGGRPGDARGDAHGGRPGGRPDGGAPRRDGQGPQGGEPRGDRGPRGPGAGPRGDGPGPRGDGPGAGPRGPRRRG